jgi:hypothetical protein
LLQASLSADRRWVAMVFREPAGGVVAPLTEAAASPANFVQVTADPNIASLHWSPSLLLLPSRRLSLSVGPAVGTRHQASGRPSLPGASFS